MAASHSRSLLFLAKLHLGLSNNHPDKDVPDFYLQELDRHLLLYPDFTRFRVKLEPGVGFGQVHCLEANCGKVISLIRRIVEPDGGIKDGFGSLSAYRNHLLSHVLIDEATIGDDGFPRAVKRKSSPDTAPFDTSSSRRTFSAPVTQYGNGNITPFRVKTEPLEQIVSWTRPCSSRVPKPEPMEHSLPPKRLSDVAFGVENNPFISTKKTKMEPVAPKIPLFPSTNTPTASSSRQATYAVSLQAESVEEKLENIKVAIEGQRMLLDRLRREFPLDAPRRIYACESELARLRTLEEEYEASIPSSSTLIKQEPIKPEPIDFKPPQSVTMDVDRWGYPKPEWKSEDSPQPPFRASSSRLPLSSSPVRDSDFTSSEYDNTLDHLGINAPPPILDYSHDENGDFYGRGRDLFLGPQADIEEIREFVDVVAKGNEDSFDQDATIDKALQALNLTDLKDKIPGMEITLMPHQVMGVAWMLEKEKSHIKGGCLADEMGLGKTVQMMTTIVMNRSEDPACKTTLIIAPLALLDQWKEEIESKTNCGLECLIYHGPNRTTKASVLMKHDVVLTTFHTMAHEWPDFEKDMKKKAKARRQNKDAFIVPDSDEEDMKNYEYRSQKRKKKAGLLFQVQFYRAIADEGQNIRNRTTRMSRAITDINAVYRWCLTGTPIVNALADVYGIIRFLKIRPWYDWKMFHTRISMYEKKNPTKAIACLQSVMNTFLLRRKKDSMLNGKKLVELPEKKIELVRLEFSQEERDIYAMVEARSQAKFNRYLRAGTVLKNYHQVLVLLLRLRQICSHPSLIQEEGVAFVSHDDEDVQTVFATELTRATRLVSAEFVARMKARFLQDVRDRMEREKLSADATIEEDDCPICFDAMTNPVVTSCAHIFCRECIVGVINQPTNDETQADCKADQRPCPVCRTPISEQTIFDRHAFEPTDAELNPDATKDGDDDMSDVEEYAPGDRKGKGKAKAIASARRSGRARRNIAESDDDGDDVMKSDSEAEAGAEDDDMSDFIVESDEDEEEKDARRAFKRRLGKGKMRANVILDSDDELDTPEEKEVIFGVPKKQLPNDGQPIKNMSKFLPSTKMKYMMDALQKRVESHPEEKTLLVSQWTGCLSLISHYLEEKGIPHVKYQGDMSRHQREVSVQVFMSKEKARVMLMSLKCGGVGLNLTRANNVISLDLGWSQAVEAQAFDRVHRVGQTREVLVQRVVIADTVEDRILKLQERKQLLADGSLGEGSGKKIGRLSVKELANLFGLDTRGRLLPA
ncbi:hypothetical protein D9613_008762 [Agrocybe pediades]|uniref:Uncharacterized protein n=1 Tax=Agrocybe pediades TaxID=84607 RepID=A0A8H4QUE9_9AGAR|nr:hypothetical protein D9613_008762 [Agrocybe pediades]